MKKIKLKSKMEAPKRYEDWKRYVFDRPVSDEPWYFDLYDDEFVADKNELVQLITYTFENCGTDLACYSDEQIRHGLIYMLDCGFSDVACALMDNQVSIDLRLRGISSIKYLYADCFEHRCESALGHANQSGNSLNYICYMLWDVSPLNFWEGEKHPDRQIFYDAVVDVLEDVLKLNNPACVESALHGLGHMLRYHKARISETLSTYLRRNDFVSPSLKLYAQRASTGNIQ